MPNSQSHRFSSVFSSRIFIVLNFNLKCLIYIELILMTDPSVFVSRCISCVCALHMDVQFSSTVYWNDYSFSIELLLLLCLQSGWLCGSTSGISIFFHRYTCLCVYVTTDHRVANTTLSQYCVLLKVLTSGSVCLPSLFISILLAILSHLSFYINVRIKLSISKNKLLWF